MTSARPLRLRAGAFALVLAAASASGAQAASTGEHSARQAQACARVMGTNRSSASHNAALTWLHRGLRPGSARRESHNAELTWVHRGLTPPDKRKCH